MSGRGQDEVARPAQGLQVRKPHMLGSCGQATKKPLYELHRFGKARRASRHDLGDHGR